MPADIDEIVKKVKAFTSDEKDRLYACLLDDPEIREDLLDYLLVLQAEAEGGEAISVDEFLSGKRSYTAR